MKPQSIQSLADCEALLQSVKEELAQGENTEQPTLIQAKNSMHLILEGIEMLKEYVLQIGFAEQSQEIHFFKNIKPQFYGRMLYYRDIYRALLNRPTGSIREQKKYFQKKQRRIKEYFDAHCEIYRYIRSGSVHLDQIYFIRTKADLPEYSDQAPETDSRFSSPLDSYLAKIVCNELFGEWLQSQLAEIKEMQGHARAVPGREDIPELQWTAPLAGMYQVIYSIKEVGAVNNGNVSVNQLARAFEIIFHVNLRNIYRGQQENRITKDPASFLRKMIKAAERKNDELDENPRQR